jgi:hypothetical protein
MKAWIGAAIVTAVLAVGGPAAAASAGAVPSKVEIRTAGSPAVNSTATDIGARRYHRRYYRNGYRPYYRPYPYYYARPYYYRPYPYYAPAPFPFGFGFGFGPWGW